MCTKMLAKRTISPTAVRMGVNVPLRLCHILMKLIVLLMALVLFNLVSLDLSSSIIIV